MAPEQLTEDTADENDGSAGLPDSRFMVRDRGHLLQLLREGMNGPLQEVTSQEWDELRQQVRERLARQQPTPGVETPGYC